MESRIFATILLLVFGIIQAYSHPQGEKALHESSHIVIAQSPIAETKFDHPVGKNFDENLGDNRVDRRIKREKKLDANQILERLYKQGRLATITREMANTEARRRDFEATVQHFYRLVDGYVERGLSVEDAIEQFVLHHPHVANQIVRNQRRMT